VVYDVVECLSICLSDCLSHAGIVKTAKLRIMQTMPHGSPVTLIFDAKDLGEI